jgi:transposase-like protein
VAYYGLKQILRRFDLSESKKVLIGYYHEREVDRLEFKNFIINEFERAKINYNKFITDGKLTEDILKSSIFLAKLDVKYRTGTIDTNLDKIESIKINELEKLYSIVPWNEFKAEKHCILNPTFGEGSKLVRGADADLIIDNKVIDIKSTKKFILDRVDLNQIIGYYLLSLIGGINGRKTPKIKIIGIYFVRYGHIWEIPLSAFHKPQEYERLSDEFIQLVKDRSLQLVKPKKRQSEKTFKKIPDYVINKNDFRCPFCRSKYFIRHGKATSGKFRYKCKNCKKGFSTKIDKKAPQLSKLSSAKLKKQKTKNNLFKISGYVIYENDFKCPFCSSKRFIRHGKALSGKFRYKCKDCNKSFSTNIDSKDLSKMIG